MEKKKNTPKLRFPEFTGEWEEKKIQKLIDDKIIISHLDGNHGGLYPRNEEFVSNGIPYITANDFAEGILYFDKCKFLTNERASKFRKGIAINGDVLFAHNATVGPTAILRTNFDYVILSTTATYFRCDNINLLNLYVEKYFNTDFFVNQYTRVMAQSTRNQVPISMQRTFSIKLPTIGEQTKIATFLTAVDEKLTQLKKKKTRLEQYKKGVMQKLFSQELRFKDDNNQDFPDWQEKLVENIFKITRGNVLSMTLVMENKDDKNRYPVYSSQTKNKGLSGYYDKFLFKNCITWTTDGAGAGDVNFRKGEFYCTNVCGVLISDEGYANQFVAELLNSISRKYVSYVGNPKLMNNVMGNISICIPSSIIEQQKIATFLSSLDEKISHCSKKIEKMEAWKKGLLQLMFV